MAHIRMKRYGRKAPILYLVKNNLLQDGIFVRKYQIGGSGSVSVCSQESNGYQIKNSLYSGNSQFPSCGCLIIDTKKVKYKQISIICNHFHSNNTHFGIWASDSLFNDGVYVSGSDLIRDRSNLVSTSITDNVENLNITALQRKKYIYLEVGSIATSGTGKFLVILHNVYINM